MSIEYEGESPETEFELRVQSLFGEGRVVCNGKITISRSTSSAT